MAFTVGQKVRVMYDAADEFTHIAVIKEVCRYDSYEIEIISGIAGISTDACNGRTTRRTEEDMEALAEELPVQRLQEEMARNPYTKLPFEGMDLEEIRDFANDYTPEKMAARGIDQNFEDWSTDDVVALTNYEDWKYRILEVLRNPDDGVIFFTLFNREGHIERRPCAQFVRVSKARPMITTIKAAEILGVSQRRVQAMCRQGLLRVLEGYLLDEQEVRALAKKPRPAHRPRKTSGTP